MRRNFHLPLLLALSTVTHVSSRVSQRPATSFQVHFNNFIIIIIIIIFPYSKLWVVFLFGGNINVPKICMQVHLSL
jgi:hypothetical protein